MKIKKIDGRPNMGVQYIIRIKNYPIWVHYYRKGMFWFRIFGYGFHFRDINHHPPLFSVRNGFQKVLKLKHFHFKILKPKKINYGKSNWIKQ